MSEVSATQSTILPEDQLVNTGDIALVVSREGSIRTAVQLPPGLDAVASIDGIWPGETASRIRTSIARTLKSNGFFSEELVSGGQPLDILYVAQSPDRVLLVARNNSSQQNAIANMRRLAYTDEVTGLPNRGFLQDELKKVVDEQRLREGRSALILFNFDGLDGEADGLSLANKHSVLCSLATRLLGELRGPNAPGEPDFERRSLVARVDYRCFGVVLPGIEDGDDAESVVKRLLAKFSDPIHLDDRTARIRTAAGIALFPQDGTDTESLLANASGAMEEARISGGRNYHFHSGTLKLKALQRADLEIELRNALDREAFLLNYLPEIDPVTGKVAVVEALLRWPDDVLGSRPTLSIISLAERIGLIDPIGQWVLRESFGQLKAWHDAGFESLRLAVNVSMQEFSRPDIATRIAALLVETGLQPAAIDLEISDQLLHRDAIRDYAACKELKAIGIRLVIDDFGAGQSSLSQLSNSPVDSVKIDNSLVAEIGSNERARSACNAAISMAHALGLAVVGEGVEQELQAQQLQELGCDLLQGFYFTKPLLVHQMTDYLTRNIEESGK